MKWMTIRSDSNDKYAQPTGQWIGDRNLQTGVTYAGPELKGATNVVLPRVDHRETSFRPAAFDATYRFITGQAPATLTIVPEQRFPRGKVTARRLVHRSGQRRLRQQPAVPGARLEVFAIDPATANARGGAAHQQVIPADGALVPSPRSPTRPTNSCSRRRATPCTSTAAPSRVPAA